MARLAGRSRLRRGTELAHVPVPHPGSLPSPIQARGSVLNWWTQRDSSLGALPLGRVEEQDGRAIQVDASHRISAFDVAERDVAGMAQESWRCGTSGWTSCVTPATRGAGDHAGMHGDAPCSRPSCMIHHGQACEHMWCSYGASTYRKGLYPGLCRSPT
jgi:hypothetical protein